LLLFDEIAAACTQSSGETSAVPSWPPRQSARR
jgi:hypothetical protein